MLEIWVSSPIESAEYPAVQSLGEELTQLAALNEPDLGDLARLYVGMPSSRSLKLAAVKYKQQLVTLVRVRAQSTTSSRPTSGSIPSSSATSRTAACRGLSPGSTYPPGRSQPFL